MELVALHHEVPELFEAAVVVFGHGQLAFSPVNLLDIAVRFDQLLIIWIVVLLFVGGYLVETLNEQSFAFQVGEAQGAVGGIHPFGDGPALDSLEQRIGYGLVVDGIEAPESYPLFAVLLVGGFLDDAHYAPDQPAVAVGTVIDGVAAVVVYVLAAEQVALVHIQRRTKVRAVFVEPERELYEILPLASRLNFPDFQHNVSICVCRGSRRPYRWDRSGCRLWG